jgi:hypothetical protein
MCVCVRERERPFLPDHTVAAGIPGICARVYICPLYICPLACANQKIRMHADEQYRAQEYYQCGCGIKQEPALGLETTDRNFRCTFYPVRINFDLK